MVDAAFGVTALPRPDECGEFGCGARAGVKGLCRRHYHAQHTEQRNRERQCAVHDCSRKVRRRGLCYLHYDRLRQENRCQTEGCSAAACIEDLCARHFVTKRARCAHGACQSRDIFCVKRMLCRTHYMQQYRRQNPSLAPQQQGLKFGVPSVFLKRPKRRRERKTESQASPKAKTVDIDVIAALLHKQKEKRRAQVQIQAQDQARAQAQANKHSPTEVSHPRHSLNACGDIFADPTFARPAP